jgi:hypothetical protein
MLRIPRSEADEIARGPGWALVHGRRKVGKTFLLQNYVPHDIYVTARRDGTSLSDDLEGRRFINGEELFDALEEHVLAGRTAIIDEFQRLPDSFLDELATLHPHGRVILSGSSLGVVERVLGRRAPMLGLVSVYRVDLVRPTDIIMGLDHLPASTVLPYAAYLREPWLCELLHTSPDVIGALHSVLGRSRAAASSLIGEVFTESGRSLTQTYEAILRGLGAGLWRPGDLANRLQNMGLLTGDGSNYLHRYLKSLEEMGLVTAVPIHGRTKWMAYRLTSEYLETFYYLADRHGIDEVDRPLASMRPNLQKMVSQSVERFVGRLLCQLEQGQLEYSFDPELDIIITQGRDRTPSLVGEVRWGRFDKRDVRAFGTKVEGFSCRKVFVGPRKAEGLQAGDVEVLGPEDLREMARAHAAKEGSQ